MYRFKVNKRIIDKIDEVKSKCRIDIPSYPEAIYEICEVALGIYLEKKRELNDFRKTIEQIFNFLQEKCNEKDYIDEKFFKSLLKIQDTISDAL